MEGTRPAIGIVDYGAGNRRSVEKAVERVGARAVLSADHDALRATDGLVLPGVGAFPAGMKLLRDGGFDDLLHERAAAGVPIFGACLGMQLLFDASTEHDGAAGLGLIAGDGPAARGAGAEASAHRLERRALDRALAAARRAAGPGDLLPRALVCPAP